MSNPVLSLCIPTNGNSELVSQVLNSIYNQKVEESLFEVVIADNGTNPKFLEMVESYKERHQNITYAKTNADSFLNQTEAYKLARGSFLKFINHRMVLLDGALDLLIEIAISNSKNKSVIYFSNGEIKSIGDGIKKYDSFNDFVAGLSYWSSWSAGIALWDDDLRLLNNIDNFNVMFPHTDILFMRRNEIEYIIDNRVLLYELPRNWGTNGTYDLFNTFAVEYVSLILDLYQAGDITQNTFLQVKKDNFNYLSDRYIIYVFLRRKCTFNLKDYKKSISFFYSMTRMRFSVLRLPKLVLDKYMRGKRMKKYSSKIAGKE